MQADNGRSAGQNGEKCEGRGLHVVSLQVEGMIPFRGQVWHECAPHALGCV